MTSLNPLTPVRVTLETPELLVAKLIVVGLVARVKSWITTVTVAVCDRVPFVAVRVAVYVPTVPLQESVDVPTAPRVTLVGDSRQVSPVVEDSVEDRRTVPVKPFWEVIVIVDEPISPVKTVKLVGLAVIVKSGTPPML
jgi:hypothetical protein